MATQLTVTTQIEGAEAKVELGGAFDEAANLAREIGDLPPEVRTLIVRAPLILRINSVGVRNWISYFQRLVSGGVATRFQALAPSLVDQLNFISNFAGGGTVESVMAPFRCAGCRSENLVEVGVGSSFNPSALTGAGPRCRQCGQATAFDDEVDEYFAFVARTAGRSA